MIRFHMIFSFFGPESVSGSLCCKVEIIECEMWINERSEWVGVRYLIQIELKKLKANRQFLSEKNRGDEP